ncbi:hypothetical protein [Wolbachia endosymbiont of Wuchereria bancrofti]|uniref:hypothetical protein n=1 Tax=Wolbachia endosymbiont of Wuchereria bancrofti TaxID=96496 RepID=UPI000B4DA5BA|nr:hypothetical protein [Wolbachia endosymbiont of Wuchereria bancrofti]OWZ25641.1 hypothetical protein CCY16_00484 [Wolbachia endosymbiont of Wuchereria bancrofti]
MRWEVKGKDTRGQTEIQKPDIGDVDKVSIMKSITDPCNLLKKPLQGLGRFLSDRNMDLKKNFPELREKNFLLNFLRETVKFLSNKQDNKLQDSGLLNLFKDNLKNLIREVIEGKVKEVVIDKGNKYCQVSKNTDKELLDGIMCKSKLKTKLLHSVK